MGRHFKDDMALYSAVREYKFLRREYPGSKHRVEALLAIGEIYKNDLGDDANARSTFEDFLRRYQHSDLVKEARAELASLQPVQIRKKKTTVWPTRAPPTRAIKKDPESASKETPGKIVRISSIKHTSGAGYTRITVNLDEKVRFESQRIDRPDRIFFDLKDARLLRG